MLKSIKSSYFIQLLFSFLKEKDKLEIIKCNKNLQNQIKITLINYKFFTNKYVVFESKNKVKEFHNVYNNILYEGGYLNGKKNGKGEEYDTHSYGQLIFEGEYSNGKRHGKGKKYYQNGQLKFEGEYLNGKKWIGKGYDLRHNLVYEIKDGKGYVKKFYDSENENRIKFEGEYFNGEKNGFGKLYSSGGDTIFIKYKGEYLNGKMNGKVKLYDDEGNLYFEGENGYKNGKGKEYYSDKKLKFEGEYLNGSQWNGKQFDENGNIIFEIKNGSGLIKEFNDEGLLQYECEYKYGSKNGWEKIYDNYGKIKSEMEYLNGYKIRGKEYYGGHLIFEGEFLYNKRLKGKEYINERVAFEGKYYLNKKWDGKGFDEEGDVIYELINGNGKIKEFDVFGKLRFEGEYLKGKRNGLGIEHDFLGKLSFEGEYLNGKRFKRRKYKFF